MKVLLIELSKAEKKLIERELGRARLTWNEKKTRERIFDKLNSLA